MAIDVLAYNSLNKDNQILRNQITGLNSCISTLNSQVSSASACLTVNGKGIIGNPYVPQPELWSQIPTGSGWTTGFKVCDTSGFFRCGRCCLWTVPAGITCARFQIWGAGGMAGRAGCCGGRPFGSAGAYASVIIPVTAGRTYTLCAGCAYCCYACWNVTASANSCASFVNGCCLSNFCAEGGRGSMCCEQLQRCNYYLNPCAFTAGASTCCCTCQLGYCGYSHGFMLCGSGGSYCNAAISTPAPTGCWGIDKDRNGWNCHINCLGTGFTVGHGFIHYPAIHSQSCFYGSSVNGDVFGIRGIYAESCISYANF